MPAVVLSRDPEIGAACAAELTALGLGDVRTGTTAREVLAGGTEIDVAVTVPEHPVPGQTDQADHDAFAAEARRLLDAVVPGMVERGRGRVVVVVTATGLPGQTWSGPAGPAMWSMVGLARTAAREVAASGVTVNVVRTGVVHGADLDQLAGSDPAVEAALGEVAGTTPLRRPVTPDDVAAAVGFLASDDASYVTGVVLPVDGGLTMGQGV